MYLEKVFNIKTFISLTAYNLAEPEAQHKRVKLDKWGKKAPRKTY